MKEDKCPLCELGMNMYNWLRYYDDHEIFESSDNSYDDVFNREGINIVGDVLFYDNSGGEYIRDTVKINYCPICGRKLKEATNE